MRPTISHNIFDQTFLLSPDRCIFWEQEKALILCDLHLGKTGHFRKSGIAVPQGVFKEDMQCLFSLIQQFKPQQLIIIGDMFHSRSNKEHDFFLKWRNDLYSLPIHLVMGNHDILERAWYDTASINVIDKQLTLDKFVFTHDIEDCEPCEDHYTFSGHMHPGISISGLSRQSLHFSCFYFTNMYAVLPAFSRFTGNFSIKPKKGEKVYAIVEKTLVKL
jgi:uncharacterized protein